MGSCYIRSNRESMIHSTRNLHVLRAVEMIRTESFVLMCLALYAFQLSAGSSRLQHTIYNSSFNTRAPRPINPNGVKTRDQQCKDNGFDGACHVEQPWRIEGYPDPPPIILSCNKLNCARKSKYETMGGPTHDELEGPTPAEGTYCGPFHICQHGQCTKVEEAISVYDEDYTFRCHDRKRPNNSDKPLTTTS